MKTGAQLYTIKSYTQNAKDFACSMKKIAEMGYKTVRFPQQERILSQSRLEKSAMQMVLRLH